MLRMNTFLYIVVFFSFISRKETDSFYLNLIPNNSSHNTLIHDPVETVKFYSFSNKSNSTVATEIKIQDTKFEKAGLVAGKMVKIMIHGFTSTVNTSHEPCRVLVPVYLKKGLDVNLICVDWSILAAANLPLPIELLLYVKILQTNVPLVGGRIATFIEFLLKNKIIENPDMVHILGHSLGAHVAGVAGAQVMQLTGKPIGRVTGLDPAGPFIDFTNASRRLKRSDASFVDVLHTDSTFLGSTRSFGHVDYFANGGIGIEQPGCHLPALTGLQLSDLGCGHRLSNSYYARTIMGEVFTGCKCMRSLFKLIEPICPKPFNVSCTDRAQFGEFGSHTARGYYYLNVLEATNSANAKGIQHR